MSWSRRTLLALSLVLAGCGFQPLYGTTSSGSAMSEELALVDVGIIADREGQQLRSFLMERLNPSGEAVEPIYRLVVDLSEDRAAFAVQDDDTITRFNLNVTANFLLLDRATDDLLMQRRSTATASFNVLDDQFATLASERNARESALEAISDDIRTQLALYFQRQPG